MQEEGIELRNLMVRSRNGYLSKVSLLFAGGLLNRRDVWKVQATRLDALFIGEG